MEIVTGELNSKINAQTFISSSAPSELMPYTNVKYPWLGYATMITLGCMLTLSLFLVILNNPSLMVFLLIDIVAIWILVAAYIITDRQRFFMMVQLKALTHSLKVLSQYKKGNVNAIH